MAISKPKMRTRPEPLLPAPDYARRKPAAGPRAQAFRRATRRLLGTRVPAGLLLALLLAAGLALVAAGVWLVYPPAGLMLAGTETAGIAATMLYLRGLGG